MVLEDYFVLEDLLPVKKYLEGLYDLRTLEPRVNLD
jgi:hypothetical protein